MSLEAWGRCSKDINEPCREHPVDCANCLDSVLCMFKEEAQAHPDKIKRCRWIRRRQRTL